MRADTNRRRHNISTVTARICKDFDYMTNIRKEDKLIIIGLTPETEKPQIEWIQAVVGVGLDFILPDASERV